MNCFNPYSPGFSIYLILLCFKMYYINCFNPYSPGFSIYLNIIEKRYKQQLLLQSLFTWIFYLFRLLYWRWAWNGKASILIHLDFLSISTSYKKEWLEWQKGFNPYSPGFSIYLPDQQEKTKKLQELQSLFTWIFYLFEKYEYLWKIKRRLQSLFTWIFYLFRNFWYIK